MGKKRVGADVPIGLAPRFVHVIANGCSHHPSLRLHYHHLHSHRGNQLGRHLHSHPGSQLGHYCPAVVPLEVTGDAAVVATCDSCTAAAAAAAAAELSTMVEPAAGLEQMLLVQAVLLSLRLPQVE